MSHLLAKKIHFTVIYLEMPFSLIHSYVHCWHYKQTILSNWRLNLHHLFQSRVIEMGASCTRLAVLKKATTDFLAWLHSNLNIWHQPYLLNELISELMLWTWKQLETSQICQDNEILWQIYKEKAKLNQTLYTLAQVCVLIHSAVIDWAIMNVWAYVCPVRKI